MTLKTCGLSPSQGAKLTGYCAIQSDDAQVIYDGWWARDGISPTISPPIQLYHPVFDEFLYLANSLDTQPTAKDLEDVYEFMWYASKIGWKESNFGGGLHSHLTNILESKIHKETNLDGSRPDGTIMLQIGNSCIMTLIMELKGELGKDSCDSSMQVSLSIRCSWIDFDVGYKHIHLDIMSNPSIDN